VPERDAGVRIGRPQSPINISFAALDSETQIASLLRKISSPPKVNADN
jgi:hypothetical protein